MRFFLVLIIILSGVYFYNSNVGSNESAYTCDKFGNCYCDWQKSISFFDPKTQTSQCILKREIEREYRCDLSDGDEFYIEPNTGIKKCGPRIN